MPIYLGSTEVLATVADPDKGIYLGDQKICSTFLGSSQTLDNCPYTPVVVTLNVSDQISGSQYSITGDSTGASRSGQAGVDTYSFTTGVSAYSGYTYSGNAPVTTSGTFPSSNTTVTSTLTGSVTQDSVPSSIINYAATTGLSGASASVSPLSRTGTPGATDNQNISVSFFGSSDFTYTNLSVGGVSFSYGSSATFSPGATFPADGTETTSSWSVTGTATAVQYTYTYTISAGTVSNASTSYSVSGGTLVSGNRTGSLGNNQSASVTLQGTTGTSISASISASANSGYELYSSPTSDNSSTTLTSNGSASISINAQANLIFNDALAEGPFYTNSAAVSCRDSGISCAGSVTVYYQGGSSGVIGSGGSTYYKSWSAATGPGAELDSGYYIDLDSGTVPSPIFYY